MLTLWPEHDLLVLQGQRPTLHLEGGLYQDVWSLDKLSESCNVALG